ncbi:MAG: DUF1223 domain-containing protein [Bacteroidetes bacterium]|nr:DUF1223 domain-containing protein [Bacteroidota bacterium]
MKRLFYFGSSGFCMLLIVAAFKTHSDIPVNKEIKKEFAPVAVLELFTSQGCSSCPPADELLGKYISKENEYIFPLSFHVDYWNYLGWKDIYSLAAYSERQKKYALVLNLETIYTPQLVVNGTNECVGSNEQIVARAINDALKQNANVQISGMATMKGNKIAVTISVDGNYKNGLLNIALVEKKTSVPVKAGENNGVTLNNYNVVLWWKTIDAVEEKNNISVDLPNDISRSNAKLIVYTQDKSSYKITGAAKISL